MRLVDWLPMRRLVVILSAVVAVAGAAFAPAGRTQEPRPALRQTAPGEYELGLIRLSASNRTVRFPAEVNLVDQLIEYALVSQDGKTHESLLRTTTSPRDLHVACLLTGVSVSTNLGATNRIVEFPAPSGVRIAVEWRDPRTSRLRTNDLSDWIGLGPPGSLNITGRLSQAGWLYSGSQVFEGGFLAQEEGSVISLIRDPVALINNAGVDRDNDDIHWPDPQIVPPKGTPVTLQLRFQR